MANSASAMPGATTPSDVFCDAAIAAEGAHDPPHRAEQPDERRDRADRRQHVEAVAERIDLARDRHAHQRRQPRADPLAVDRPAGPCRVRLRRHSFIPAMNSRADGCAALLAGSYIASRLSAFQNHASNDFACALIALSRRPRSRMIAHDATDAAISPSMTSLTTMSAWRNSASGDMSTAVLARHRELHGWHQAAVGLVLECGETGGPRPAAAAAAGRSCRAMRR